MCQGLNFAAWFEDLLSITAKSFFFVAVQIAVLNGKGSGVEEMHRISDENALLSFSALSSSRTSLDSLSLEEVADAREFLFRVNVSHTLIFSKKARSAGLVGTFINFRMLLLPNVSNEFLVFLMPEV